MKNKNRLLAVLLSLGLLTTTFFACSSDDDASEVIDENAEEDEEEIGEEVADGEGPPEGEGGGPPDGGGGPGGNGDDGGDINIPLDDGETVSQLHAAFAEFDSDRVEVTISDDGTDYIITSNGRPNHVTTYYPVDNELYEFEPDVDHTGQAEGELTRIFDDGDYEVTLTVDATPNRSGVEVDTEINEIGISVSGGYIYNNLEGPVELTEQTAESLDYTGGHIGPSNYHYHLEPTAFSEDDDKLIGILLDGVFIYGRRCESTGDYPTDLDGSGGHTHVTSFSNGEEEYHYHMINEPFFEGGDDYLIFEGPYLGF